MDRALYKLNYSYKTGDLLVNTREEVEYCVILNKDGSVNNITVVDNKKLYKGTGTNDKDITIVNIDKPENVSCQITNNNDTPTTVVTTADYKETLLHGTDPVLKGDLIPVILTSTEEDWTVTYADVKEEWYKYSESKWANAVKLVSSPSATYSAGDVIAHEDISAYFVWIPRYKYKLFNMGNYNSLTEEELTPKNQLIDIVFGTETTIDTLSSCKTPMTSGESGNCAVGKYMTHPAFISFNSNGFWVGKFVTTGSLMTDEQLADSLNESTLTILPGASFVPSSTVKTYFNNGYKYNRVLDSHMMKNTEWGAVAYLSNSLYGRGNSKIWRNNNTSSTTGCVANSLNEGGVSTCNNPWYKTRGTNGSTTGNITGIYDMAGGMFKYMAAMKTGRVQNSGFSLSDIENIEQKYLDIYKSNSNYTTYKNRILGDATGEMGPFATGYKSSWYNDYSVFVDNYNSWFSRSGYHVNRDGLFYFTCMNGSKSNGYAFYLVLTPQ